MAKASQDTEITLGTGKMLALFFALVALCAVFFGIGFSLGRSSLKSSAELASAPAVPTTAARPTAVKQASANSADLTFYKSVQKDDDTAAKTDALKPAPAAAETAQPESKPAPPDPSVAMPTNGYFVQVAAVTKEEDAQALVDALKKKQYAALVATSLPVDKLFHVQVGPFSDVKDAEVTRAKLVSDGYNPILKK